jgi:hypothetical protein
MRWADVSLDGEWSIPKEAREKDTAGALVPDAALALIVKKPRLDSNPCVFAGRGYGPYRGFSQAKSAFDAKLPDVAPSGHSRPAQDRTFIDEPCPDIAERVMGHAIAGVEGVYDRHSYREEKADALRKLAALVDGIVNPRENIVAIRKQKTSP